MHFPNRVKIALLTPFSAAVEFIPQHRISATAYRMSVDQVGNLLVCAASELTGNSEVCRNELYAWFGKWIGWPDINHPRLSVREQDRILRATARDVYTAELRAHGISVTYRDLSKNVISGPVDYRQKNISTVTVSWGNISRTCSSTRENRNDARTAFLKLIKWCCDNNCFQNRQYPAATRPIVNPSLFSMPSLSARNQVVTPGTMSVQDAISVDSLQGGSTTKGKAAKSNKFQTSDAVLALLELSNGVPTIGTRTSANAPFAVTSCVCAVVGPVSVVRSISADVDKEFVASTIATAAYMALSASNASTASVHASNKANAAEKDAETACIAEKDSIAEMNRLIALAVEASSVASAAVSASLAALAAVLTAKDDAIQNTRAAFFAMSRSTSAKDEAGKASNVAKLTAAASEATSAVAKAVAGESYVLSTAPTVASNQSRAVVSVPEVVVSVPEVVVCTQASTLAKADVLGETCDYVVEANHLQQRVMQDAVFVNMSMRTRMQMVSLQTVLDKSYKDSIIRIYVNSVAENNSLMGWSKILVDNPVELCARVAVMISGDKIGTWRRNPGQQDQPLLKPTWGAYELFRRLGVKGRFRTSGANKTDNSHVFAYLQWTFKNDDAYKNASKRLYVGFYSRDTKRQKVVE